MKAVLPIDKYLALNQGRYYRETLELPDHKSSHYITTHLEAADTALPHYHDSVHLSFILNGAVVDKRRSSETERIAGDLMFFRSGEVHESIYRAFPSKNINIELRSAFFERNSISESYLENAAIKSGHAKITLLRMYKEMLSADSYSQASIEMLLIGLITGCTRSKPAPAWLNLIVDLLNDRWCEDISLNDLAKAGQVHPKTVSKYFPRFFGCTLGEYRRKIRVERSISLIRSSRGSLTEIAHACGFYDQSHFSAAFQRLTGFAPGRFRRL